jgi:hypothetical protein
MAYDRILRWALDLTLMLIKLLHPVAPGYP